MRIKSKALVGGANVRVDRDELARGDIHIVVGTPGRIFDFI